MGAEGFATVGFSIASIVSALVTVLSLAHRKFSRVSDWLILAGAISVFWSATLVAQGLGYVIAPALIVTLEWSRCLAWLLVVVAILKEIDQTTLATRIATPVGFGLLGVAILPAVYHSLACTDHWSSVAVTAVGFAASVPIIVLSEQIIRNSASDSRSGLNYVCLALIGIFAYDSISYIQSIVEMSPAPQLQAARGFVNALLLVPLGFGVWRVYRSASEEKMPRQIVFHAISLTFIGVIVALTIVGRYYVLAYGGDWGEAASIALVVGVAAVTSTLLMSPSIRARVRVGLMKTFFAYKYDYRKEWLRFIATLSASATEKVPTTAVRAVAQIVNSPGGVVWVQDEEGADYLPIGSWHYDISGEMPIDRNSALIRFLEDRQWIIDTEEMKQFPARYEGLRLEDVVEPGRSWWIVVPMFLGKRLLGFITLEQPGLAPRLNFEDHDLLRTVGRHVAMHIYQAEADKRMTESSQFGAYNRLTAFLMHDLNNLIAQQSLVVKNAERFRHDSRFVDDAIDTIANCVSRMTRLMEQLSAAGAKDPVMRPTNLYEVLQSAIGRCQSRQPAPTMQCSVSSINVLADKERLTYVFEHLIRNSQDATDVDGEIRVDLALHDHHATVKIIDSGEGMTRQFIRERLFRPFDSTKGSHAMGIGACQARDYVRSLGGQVSVTSEVGAGTSFEVRLPIQE